MLHLAAANGRTADEALQSAIAWSRLGLTRAQVNEAVRVSLQAANVAELTAADSTERLSAIMATYNLRVGELSGVLGMVNATSNTWNVTNQDLFDGLSKVAVVAKQAGIPLAELIGMIGAGVGMTGQTGANFGNAIKSVIGSLTNKETQSFLRNQFKIEMTASGGEDVKNMSKALAELYVAYQKLSDAERQHLVYTVAGKNQASRMTALLDGYVRAQVLAINAQLNLNSGEKENALILDSLKAQLAGVVTEWERFVMLQGKNISGPVSGITSGLRNALTMANTPTGSMISTGFIGLLAAAGARMAVTAATMRTMGSNAGFVVNSLQALNNAFSGLGSTMNQVITNWASMAVSAGGLRGRLGAAAYQLVIWSQRVVIADMVTGKFSFGLRTLSVTARLAAVALIGISQAILPIIGVMTVFSIFNKLMSMSAAQAEAADRKVSGFSDAIEQASKSASAAGQTQKLFDTVSKSLPNARPEARRRMLDEAASVAYPTDGGDFDAKRTAELKQQLSVLIQQANTGATAQERAAAMSEVQARLEGLKNEAAARRIAMQGRELQLLDEQRNAIQEQISEQQELIDKKGKTPEREAKLQEKQKQLSENQNRRIGSTIEYASANRSDLEARLNADVRHIALMEREKMIAESLRDIYADNAGQTNTGRFDADLQAKQAQLQHQKQLMEEMKNDPQIKRKSEQQYNDSVRDKSGEFKEAIKAQSEARKSLDEFADGKGINVDKAVEEFSKWKIRKDFTVSNDFGPRAGTAVNHASEWLSEKLGIGVGDKDKQKVNEMFQSYMDLTTRANNLKSELQAIKKGGVGATETGSMHTEELKELQKELEKTESDILKMDTAMRKLNEQRDRNQVTRRFGSNEAQTFSVGETEGERLAAMEKGLSGLLTKRAALVRAAKDEATANDQAVLAMQALNDMEELQIRKREMQAKLEAEKLSLMKEQTREFQRSLLLASPGDLLRKLAVKQIGDRNGGSLNLGQFMALDERARKDAQDAFPSINPRVQDVQRQIEAVGPKQGLQQDQDIFATFRDIRQFFMRFIKPEVGGKPDFISEQARGAGEALGVLKLAATSLTDAFGALEARLASTFTGRGPMTDTPTPWHPVDATV